MTGTMRAVDFRTELGKRVNAARVSQRYSIASAAKAAVISRDTWKKIEKGQPVHDTKLRAALDLLGLDDDGVLPAQGSEEPPTVDPFREEILASHLPKEYKEHLVRQYDAIREALASTPRDEDQAGEERGA